MIEAKVTITTLRIETVGSVIPSKAVTDLNNCSDTTSTPIVNEAIIYYTTNKGHYIYTYTALRDISLAELEKIEALFTTYTNDVIKDNKTYWTAE